MITITVTIEELAGGKLMMDGYQTPDERGRQSEMESHAAKILYETIALSIAYIARGASQTNVLDVEGQANCEAVAARSAYVRKTEGLK